MSKYLDIRCDGCGDFAILVGEVTDVVGDGSIRRAFRCRGCDTIHWRRVPLSSQKQQGDEDGR
jgi:hypothetical protein